MSNLSNCGGHHPDDRDSDDNDDGDIILQNLKMKKLPTKKATCSSSRTTQQIVINGSRCILYGELINGPFIVFALAQNSHINTICIYNEYYVENKMHHINLLEMNCVLVHNENSILIVMMSADVYEKVVNQRGDISESLNNGTSHVLEFLVDNEHSRDTIVEDIKSLSIDFCRVCHHSDTSDASSKKSLYERLCPEVFLIWREVCRKDLSDATTDINLINRMHVYLREKVHSTFDQSNLFYYPLRGNIHFKSKDILMGMKHIQSKRDTIAFDAHSYTHEIKGEILQRLMQDASLDDRLISFWFRWCENQLYEKTSRKKIKFVDSLITTGNRNYANLSDRNYGIFKHDIIMMPIHFDHHWSLAVIENPELVLMADGIAGDAHPKIYHYDSLTHKGYGHSKSVVSEVVNEFLEKAVSTVGGMLHILPKLEKGDAFGTQDGSLDCGLFVCKFIEHIFQKASSDSIVFRRITQKDCTEFREEMITLLARLACHHSQVREKYL